jgi:hypothetical protein
MAFRLVYPDSRKRPEVVQDRQDAIDRALVEANDRTVEVWESMSDPDDDVMLARYEQRPPSEPWTPVELDDPADAGDDSG